jgi:RHS repeat-associated protein
LDSNQTACTYDDANRMTTVTLPNGAVSASSYNNASRLTGISYVKGLTTLASVSYTVDAVGNRSDRTDAAGTQTYAYDDLYRLTSVTYPGPTTTSYGYDAFGNRTSMTVARATTNYSYDDASRLTTVTPPSPAPAVSYTWDNNGDLTQRGSDTFTWDFEDRMKSATVSGVLSTFTYSGDGLRNTRTTGGVTDTFTWDITSGVPQVLSDSNATYVYGAGLIEQRTNAGTPYYYLSDGLGSVLKTTDASGNVVNSYSYDVYGKTTTNTGAQANDRQFAGEETDATGLQYLRARYYDPATGTFLSRDPLAALPAWNGNPFTYASGNPSSASDPTGLDTVWDDSRQIWTDSNNRNYVWTEATGWYDETNGSTWSESGGWQSPGLGGSPQSSSPQGASALSDFGSGAVEVAKWCAADPDCRGFAMAVAVIGLTAATGGFAGAAAGAAEAGAVGPTLVFAGLATASGAAAVMFAAGIAANDLNSCAYGHGSSRITSCGIATWDLFAVSTMPTAMIGVEVVANHYTVDLVATGVGGLGKALDYWP